MEAERLELMQELVGVLDKVTEGRVKVTELNENLAIVDDLGLLSLDLLELAFEIEVRWDLNLKETDYGNLRTVKDVVDLILTHRKKRELAGSAAARNGVEEASGRAENPKHASVPVDLPDPPGS